MITLTSLLQHLAVIAQAGGGGSFGGGGQAGGGGGFGGGGGGGDGGGGGILIELVFRLLLYLIRLAIEVPIVGVPLLILISLGVLWMWNEGTFEVKKRTIRKHHRKHRNIRSAQSSEVLRGSDPGFSEKEFLERVGRAFLKTQEGWCSQDLGAVSLFISDGIHERFSLQIEEQQQEGWRQDMEGTEVRSALIADVDVGDQFDMLTVRISFRSNIHRLDLESGKRILGSKLPRTAFAEAWTFLRGHGTKTLTSEGLMEGHCPNCGAELVMRQSARCEHCDCHAKSGQFDWVLAEITQWSEWTPESAEWIPGYRAHQALDEGWHPQVMEDLVSVVFWRMIASDRRGNGDLLRGHTTGDFLETYTSKLQSSTEDGRPSFLVDCAVGSVRTTGLLSGPERDRAVVEVVWDGRRARVNKGGSLKVEDRRTRRCKHFVFSRSAGVKTDRSSAFSTAHCRECGAHDDGGSDPECRYCGAPRGGDSSLWLLESAVGRRDPEGEALFRELSALREKEAPDVGLKPTNVSAMNLLRWSVALVHADGIVTNKERARVHAIAGRAGLSPQEADGLLDDSRSRDETPAPKDGVEARAWLEELSKLALEDGNISRRERRFLQRAAKTLHIPPREFRKYFAAVHKDLYRNARSARRRWAPQPSPYEE